MLVLHARGGEIREPPKELGAAALPPEPPKQAAKSKKGKAAASVAAMPEPLRRELRPAFSSDPVVLTPAAVLGGGPLRCDVTLALKPVQHGIQHAVGPL